MPRGPAQDAMVDALRAQDIERGANVGRRALLAGEPQPQVGRHVAGDLVEDGGEVVEIAGTFLGEDDLARAPLPLALAALVQPG